MAEEKRSLKPLVRLSRCPSCGGKLKIVGCFMDEYPETYMGVIAECTKCNKEHWDFKG